MDSLGKKGQVPCVSVALAGSGWKPHQGMWNKFFAYSGHSHLNICTMTVTDTRSEGSTLSQLYIQKAMEA